MRKNKKSWAARLTIVLVPVLICTLITGFWTFFHSTKRYESTAAAFVLTKPDDSSGKALDPDEVELVLGLLAGDRIINDVQAVAMSDVMLDKVRQELSGKYPWAQSMTVAELRKKLDTRVRNETRILNLVGIDSRPERAAALADAAMDVLLSGKNGVPVERLLTKLHGASVPSDPVFPKPARFLVLAGILGLFGGIVLNFRIPRLTWWYALGVLAASAAAGGMFAFLLRSHYYVYPVFMMLGVVFYEITKRYGREFGFLLLIPTVALALVATGAFFLLDFYDHNGLNPLKLHPFVLAILVMVALSLWDDLLQGRFRFDRVLVLTASILFFFFSITFLKRGMSGISFFNHNYLGTLGFFFFIYNQRSYSRAKLTFVSNVLLGILTLVGILGIVEYLYQINPMQVIYDNETPVWLGGTYAEGYRIKTVLGHPLDNAMMFLFAMILTQVNIKNTAMKYGMLILFMMDILVTGSRSIFLISFLVLLYNSNLKGSGMAIIKKYIMLLIPMALIVGVLIMSPLGHTFLNRLDKAGDSTEARYLFMNYFMSHLVNLNPLGLGGATENIYLYNANHEQVYLENPWLILFFDVGYFVLLLIGYLYAVIRRSRYPYLLLVMLLALSGMNSFGVKTILIYALFYLLSYFYAIRQSEGAPVHAESRELDHPVAEPAQLRFSGT